MSNNNHTDASLKDLSASLNEIYNSYSQSDSAADTPKTNSRYFKITSPNLSNLGSSQNNYYSEESILDSIKEKRADTLDSNIDYPNESENQSLNIQNLPHTHITSHLNAGNNDDQNIRSLPQSPINEAYLDYAPQPHRALTNSSLMLIEDVENVENDLIMPNANSPEDSRWDDDGAAKILKTETDSDGVSKVKVVRRTVSDFKFGRTLGDGSYSTVILATDKHTTNQYAIKVLDKRHIIKEKKVKYVNIEKNSLNRLGKRNGIIHLFFTFQDKTRLYFVLDYAPNGELLSLIKKYGTLNEECVKYYGIQMLDAIKFMHDNGIVHRDIKPENILIDEHYRIQITDFGTAKLLDKLEDGDYPTDVKANSFVGTAEYVSPELLDRKYCGKPSDLWAYGCIIYQMIAGKPPFKATNDYLTFQKITKLQFAFSAGFPMTIRDLIKQILVVNPKQRATISKIQRHFFFQNVNWNDHEAIWETKPPELGPYKMNAKAMMKAPELTQRPPSSQQKSKPAASRRISSSQSHSSPNLLSAPGTPTSESVGSSRVPSSGSIKPLNAASAAAVALSRNPNDIITENNIRKEREREKEREKERERERLELDSESISGKYYTSPQIPQGSTTPKAPKTPKTPKADVIPGTNILRPVISSSPSISSSRSTDFSRFKSSEPAAMTTLDLAWSRFLTHPDERILKLGIAMVYKTQTEAFERRYKGLISDAPLGFTTRRAPNNVSFLSQVAHGTNAGLRKSGFTTSVGASGSNKINEEKNAVKVYEEVEEEVKSEDESTGVKFKKFFISTNYNNSQYVHDPPKERTVIITSFGRALMLERKNDEFGLAAEVNIAYPFIKFKEVVSDKRGNGKLIPTTGIFAIESSYTTFVYEVEKAELNKWTNMLAKARVAELDRQTRLPSSQDSDAATSSSNSYSGNGNKYNQASAPGLLESPNLADSKNKASSNQVSGSGGSETVKRSSSERKNRESLLMSRLRSKPISSKPKPVPKEATKSILGMSGLPSVEGDLVAARLAVLKGSQSTPTDNRRSSFSKDESSSSSRGPVRLVTGMNSKLLSRSSRKK